MKNPLVLLVLGRPGSGKGTQVGYLKRDLGFFVVTTGALLRRKMRRQDYTGKKLRVLLENGDLVPNPIVFQIWMKEFERLGNKECPGIIMDGAPRMLSQARILDEVFEWYGWTNVTLLNIVISEKEAITRLVKRARFDDELSDIKNRLRWFTKEVEPVLRYYKKQGRRIDIQGEQSRTDVYKEIREKLGI